MTEAVREADHPARADAARSLPAQAGEGAPSAA